MGNKKKSLGSKPGKKKEVKEKLSSPTMAPVSTDPMEDPKVIKVLEELEKLKKFNSAYQNGIKMTQHHLRECHAQTGAILPSDVEYCLELAKRMAEFKS